MPFWLVGLPLGKNKRKELAWELLQERTASAGLSTNTKLEIPELRIGTLDTLMQLSDDLAKSNTLIEGVVNKLKRQATETSGDGAVLKVDGYPADVYLTRFKWDEAKFPIRRPLKETVEKISEIIARIEDDLKVKVSEYNTMKSQLNAASRKQTGSLSVRDISSLVKPQHMVDSENLTTMFVVVSKFALQEWEAQYEKLTNFVVPRSSKVVSEDNDYALVNVVLFKRVVDEFKTQARAKGYQVREYQPPVEGQELSAAQAEALRKEVEGKRAALEAWCRTAYGEAFSAWVHVTAIRVFVESILRYGLPPAYQAAVVRPADKQEVRLRTALAATFSDGKNAQFWKDDGSAGAAGMGTEEMFPYVSFTLNVE
uniref:V-type proton ATPase subunit C n=1 Tax=Chlamydomonas leiostraca TaxID=1034604 RepID=A0A7S0RL04_9CHLO|mmetsp:Transcript_25178/g.63905  ORF Transcript_25178/g.63905 Transcript_25178/m.63905 type:complete len:370 (+) Transcript_25178:108-1217(+)|eukprot:CAMPEP_0202881146 /NCGR_PEP_ID=MMETSP1391-20130828/36114_1 /ASSEMBLY_ACC=CAM_ASM_000867 /TAXON_ID=1034604 /ORGANISM="Chlamydomonas leiostraca, Strain SAG 11-49" /LENGTH=369 /DNA_ID=CAMNT_0049563779 /DNA_START=119 /DNA_END=1228 /DNA_ORIENTATION=-